ncbi:SDR family oxidoreductase [Candidatus Sumerlaeota bacterium]|nr:SDR family oxidoreductase [Candidatus Sumerlaeota bacterium]
MDPLASKIILLTGASGFLGSNLTRRMLDRRVIPHLTMHGADPGYAECETHAVDLTDNDAAQALLEALKPQIIIHCAARTASCTNEKERDATWEANVTSTENLLLAAPEARFIYLSTDLVFDGFDAPYVEDDAPNPRGWYGETKFAGERQTRVYSRNFAIIRTALIYGEKPPQASRDCFLGWMHQGCQEDGLTLFTDEYRTPVYVGDLCELILRMAEGDFCGTLHAGGAERISRYEFGLNFCQAFGYSPTKITPTKLTDVPFGADRAPDVTLDCSAARRVADYDPCDVISGLQQVKANQNKDKSPAQ